MSDDLRRRLDALSQRLPDGSPDVTSVVVAGRRHKRRRVLARAVSSMALLSVMAVAATSLDFDVRDTAPPRPGTHDDHVFVPAEPGEPTYILTDFRIEYPWAKVDGMPGFRPGSERRERYCSIRKAACVSKGNAGFFYHWEWSTDRYPGSVQCRVILYSKNGDSIGHSDWWLSGLEPTSRRADGLLVHVSEEPERAEASCEAGTYEGGPGYRATLVRIERVDATTDRLHFDIEHLTEHSPDARECFLITRLESGKKQKAGPFSLMTGEEKPIQMRAPHPVGDPVTDAELKCRAFKGKEHTSRSSGTADHYRLVAREGDMRVYAPSRGQPFGWCPQNAQDLAAGDLAGAEDAVLLAKDEITGSGLNTEDAHTDSGLATDHSGPPDFSRMITRSCESSLVERTALVALRLPKVDSASMSAETYFVSREPRGWVIWYMW